MHYMGRPLDLANPRTFNEKLQWLKLYNRNPLYTTLVDKVAAKKWATEKLGEQYIIKTLGVWPRFDDIGTRLPLIPSLEITEIVNILDA